MNLVAQEQKITERAFHLALIAQKRGGVEHRHHPYALAEGPLSVFAGDTQVGFDDLHAGDPAEGDDDLRADQAGLLAQPADTALLFVVLRVAVHGRTAFDDICDVDVLFAVKIDGVQHFVEELSGSADERLALQILLFARTFADEQDLCAFAADAEDDVVPLFAQAAGGTAFTFLFKLCPCGQFLHLNSNNVLQSHTDCCTMILRK